MFGRWRICERVHTAQDDESLLLLSPDGTYFGLDSIGAAVWRGIQTGRLGQTLDELAARYGVARSILERDISTLLEELEQAGLIERAGRDA